MDNESFFLEYEKVKKYIKLAIIGLSITSILRLFLFISGQVGDKMLKFHFDINQVEYNKSQIKVAYNTNQYPEVLYVVGKFIIKINNRIFFNEPYFPILEFIRALEHWDKINTMFYNGIETEDNPLISFVACKEGWKIKSPWQLFEFNDYLAKRELLESIEILTECVKDQLENDV